MKSGNQDNLQNKEEQKGKNSVFRAQNYWYIASGTSELKKTPIKVKIWDTPIVLFRSESGQAHALLDRCAHRNVPLSDGTCEESGIRCPYHGWVYDGSGTCIEVPALDKPPSGKSAQVPSFPVKEQQGYIWVYPVPGAEPNHEPYHFKHLDEKGYTVIRYQTDFDATIHATAENILDVPHTAYLHKGLFRGEARNKIETVVRRYPDRAECEYIGEPRPTGIMASIMAPGGGEVEHTDRFILPSVAEVEYRLGEHAHLKTVSHLTPIADHKTRMYAVVTVRLKTWIPFLRQLVTPFAMKVVRQDKDMLAKQTKMISDFGGEHYVYSEADLLGPAIVRLLRKATGETVNISKEAPSDETEAEHVRKSWLNI